MRTIIEHILYGIVVLPAAIVLTEVLNVATFPALGVIFLISTTTTFANAFIKSMRAGEFS